MRHIPKFVSAGFGSISAYAHQVGGRALRMTPVYNMEGGGGSGDAGNPWQPWAEPQGNQQQQPPAANQGNSDGNNSNNSFDFTKSIWETPSNEGGQQQQTNQPPAQQPQQQPPNHQAFLDTHLANMGLTNGLDFEAMAAGGDAEAIRKNFDTFAKNAYMGIMRDMNSIMQERISEAVTKAVEKSTGTVQSWQAVEKLQSALPFTADPNIAPVANSTLQRFLGMGQPLDLAIKNTGEYFRHLTSRVGGNMPQQQAQRPGSNPNRGYANTPSSNAPRKADEDWMSFLTARN